MFCTYNRDLNVAFVCNLSVISNFPYQSCFEQYISVCLNVVKIY